MDNYKPTQLSILNFPLSIQNTFYIMNRKSLYLSALCLLLGTASLPAQELKDWANFGKYAAENQAVEKPVKVVFMGNSITENWRNIDPDFFTENGYVGRGISGQVSAQMLMRFRPDVIELQPQIVVILAGTNDVAHNDFAVTPQQTFGNIKSMVELAEANNIKVILCSTMPASSFGWHPDIKDAAKTIIELNKQVKAYAESKNIPYVDYHRAMADEHGGLPKKYSDDGVHPTLEGYKIMEDLVQTAIRKLE